MNKELTLPHPEDEHGNRIKYFSPEAVGLISQTLAHPARPTSIPLSYEYDNVFLKRLPSSNKNQPSNVK